MISNVIKQNFKIRETIIQNLCEFAHQQKQNLMSDLILKFLAQAIDFIKQNEEIIQKQFTEQQVVDFLIFNSVQMDKVLFKFYQNSIKKYFYKVNLQNLTNLKKKDQSLYKQHLLQNVENFKLMNLDQLMKNQIQCIQNITQTIMKQNFQNNNLYSDMEILDNIQLFIIFMKQKYRVIAKNYNLIQHFQQIKNKILIRGFNFYQIEQIYDENLYTSLQLENQDQKKIKRNYIQTIQSLVRRNKNALKNIQEYINQCKNKKKSREKQKYRVQLLKQYISKKSQLNQNVNYSYNLQNQETIEELDPKQILIQNLSKVIFLGLTGQLISTNFKNLPENFDQQQEIKNQTLPIFSKIIENTSTLSEKEIRQKQVVVLPKLK